MDVQVYDCKKYNLKPEIRIGNYYFRWDTNGLGIDVHEINHLKNFIRKTIPVLEQYMILLQHEKQNNHDKRDPYRDKKQICIKEKCNKRVSFLMFIDSQGTTVFYREESCDIVDFELESGDQVYSENSSNSSSSNTSDRNNHDHDHGCGRRHIRVELKWLLGELLFDRKLQKQKKIKFRL